MYSFRYVRQYYNSSSNDFGKSQTANALGLLAAPTIAPGAVARLVANIKGRSTHISTGAVGARWILQVRFLLVLFLPKYKYHIQ